MWMLQPKASFLACQKMTLTIHEAIFYYKENGPWSESDTPKIRLRIADPVPFDRNRIRPKRTGSATLVQTNYRDYVSRINTV